MAVPELSLGRPSFEHIGTSFGFQKFGLHWGCSVGPLIVADLNNPHHFAGA